MSAEPLRILIVSTALPYPASGFGTRVWQLSRYLAERHDVTLLTYARPWEMSRVQLAAQACTQVEVVPRTPPGHLARRARQVAVSVSRQPFAAVEQRSKALQVALDRLVSTRRFDLVQLESSRLWSLRLPKGPAIILDEHNVEYELLQRMRQGESSGPRRFFNRIEEAKFRRLEQRSWTEASGVAVTSEREEEVVRRHAPGTPCVVVPNAVDARYYAPLSDGLDDASGLAASDGSSAKTIVFTGLLSYRPNLDAAQYLVDQILPHVHRTHPDVELHVVGGFGRESEVAGLRRPGVVVTGWVTDIRPHLRRAAVVVAPLRMGSGTRLKVLEAMSMGKALVSTSIGSEGIMVTHNDHLMIADDPIQFAQEICRLLDNPELARRIANAGRNHVLKEYSWQGAGARLEYLHAQALGSSGGTDAPPAMARTRPNLRKTEAGGSLPLPRP